MVTDSIEDMIADAIGSRSYGFVIMSWGAKYDLFLHIRDILQRPEVGLPCIRADHVKGAGEELLAKIHRLIERAEVVIAEISQSSPNVFYEIGYAKARDKAVILIAERNVEVPTDLRGLELIRYGGSRGEMEQFDRDLIEHVKSRVQSNTPHLRDMLLPPNPLPSFLVTSPRHRHATPYRPGQPYDERTFGDYLGVMGLISAFGVLRGETTGLELISAQNHPPDLLERNANLYMIGSKKVNPTAGIVLEQLQRGQEPNFVLRGYPGPEETGDYRVELRWTRNGEESCLLGALETRAGSGEMVQASDYGIIVRGPHPKYPGRMVLLLAGAHSLGSGAACLAATRSPLIRRIQEKLLAKDLSLSQKDKTIWVLVEGRTNPLDAHLYMEGVTILEAGSYLE